MRLDAKDWDYLATLFPPHLVAAMRADATRFYQPRHAEVGLHFQEFLLGLVLANDHEDFVAVETGVRTGISTMYLLQGLLTRGAGQLYSCDPCYRDETHALCRMREIWERQWPGAYEEYWHFKSGPSRRELPLILAETKKLHPRGWDLFVHDSEHGPENLRFELSFALDALAPGGFLVADDFQGPDNIQHTFADWALEHCLDWTTLGKAAVVRKPNLVRVDVPLRPEIKTGGVIIGAPMMPTDGTDKEAVFVIDGVETKPE
jgi:hypothetical protein